MAWTVSDWPNRLQMMNDAEKEDEKKEEAEKDAIMHELHNLDNVDEGDDVSA